MAQYTIKCSTVDRRDGKPRHVEAIGDGRGNTWTVREALARMAAHDRFFVDVAGGKTEIIPTPDGKHITTRKDDTPDDNLYYLDQC